MGGRLTLDPGGAATVLDLATNSGVEDVYQDRQDIGRHALVPVQVTAHVETLPGAPLALRLTNADRATFHGWMDELAACQTLRVQPDGAGGTAYDVVLLGEPLTEEYEWIAPDLWRIRFDVVHV